MLFRSVKGEEHLIERLTAGETYTLREEMAPYGYLMAEEITFTVEDTAEIQKVEMKDDVPTGTLIINKKGEFLDKVSVLESVGGWIKHLFEYFSGSLKEVTFEVYALEDIKAADGESEDYYKKDALVATITTDETGVAKLTDLPLGKYYVKEKETANGYVLDGETREVDLTYRDQNTAEVTYSADWQNKRQKAEVKVLKKAKDSEKIAEAMDEVGKDGAISVEDSQTFGIDIDVVQGMQYDRGYISPYMATDSERMEAVLNDPYILLTDLKVTSIQDMVPLLEGIMKAGRPLLIVAEDVEGEALGTLLLNKLRGTLNVVAIKAPGFGDRRARILEDIAVVTGGKVVSKDFGMTLADVTVDALGTAKTVKVSKDATVIVDGAGDKAAIDARVAQMRNELEHLTSDFDKEKLQERLSKLSGGVAVLKVGAATESELKEKKSRIEDALQATRAAVEEGIVAGGGVALINAISALDAVEVANADEQVGVDIIRKALEAPMRAIATNAGYEGSVVVEKAKAFAKGEGYNFANGEEGSMIEMGVSDPVKVTRTALQSAASVAGLILITEATINEIPKEGPDLSALAGAGQGGGMGMM